MYLIAFAYTKSNRNHCILSTSRKETPMRGPKRSLETLRPGFLFAPGAEINSPLGLLFLINSLTPLSIKISFGGLELCVIAGFGVGIAEVDLLVGRNALLVDILAVRPVPAGNRNL